jgi:TIR domain
MSGKIFISYRRDDAAGHAGRIYDRLNARLPNSIFMDVSGIEPGADFVQTIEEAVGACDTLIVLMGKHWRGGRGPGEERLDDPNDFVRLEVATALKRNIRVLPVLLRGAVMPTAQELPADIAPLARRLALEITDEDFDHDIQRLVEVIEPRDRARPITDRGTWRKFVRSAMVPALILAAAAVTFWFFNRQTDPFLVYYLVSVLIIVGWYWAALKFNNGEMQIRAAKYSFLLVGALVRLLLFGEQWTSISM